MQWLQKAINKQTQHSYANKTYLFLGRICYIYLHDRLIALMDGKTIETIQGSFKSEGNKQDIEKDNPPKHFVENLTTKAVEATRDNVAYLQQSISKPVVAALKGLKGF